jgi:hypothetical protein
MKGRHWLILNLIFCVHFASAQVSHSLGAEAGGPAGLASLNYEFSSYIKPRFQLGINTGLGSFKLIDFRNRLNPDLIVPISLQSFYGRGKHSLVTAVGIVGSYMVYAHEMGVRREWQMGYFARLGYRFRKSEKARFSYQIGYIPIINVDGNLKHWSGLLVMYKL